MSERHTEAENIASTNRGGNAKGQRLNVVTYVYNSRREGNISADCADYLEEWARRLGWLVVREPYYLSVTYIEGVSKFW